MAVRRVVLVVEPDQVERQRMGGWLSQAGREVIYCPGPSEPDYTCIGVRRNSCPLTVEAELIVLDLRLGSDIAHRGTPGWAVLLFYVETGKPVVVLAGDEDAIHPLPDGEIAVLPRRPERRELLDAVSQLLSEDSKVSGAG